MARKSYLTDGRLEDVIALIQVLGLDGPAHRVENQVKTELQGKPTSAKTWMKVAEAHREFFRVWEGRSERSVSLIARHFSSGEDAPRLTPDHVFTLVQSAIATYNAQIQREQIRKAIFSLGGLLALFEAIIHLLPKAIEYYEAYRHR